MSHTSSNGTRNRRRVIVIVNPAAGRRRRTYLARVLGAVARRGCAVTVRETTGPGDAKRLAASIGRDEADAVVVAGGDGTLNEAVNGLHPASPPLGVIPMGTANVFAAELGLPTRPDSLAAAIVAGPPRSVWAPALNDRLFLQMAGVGFDAAVVEAIDPNWKRRLGKLAYVAQSAALMLRYDFPMFDVRVDGAAYRAGSVIVANGRYYAGRYVCAPRASLYAPSLQVCLFAGAGATAVLSYGAALMMSRLPRHRGLAIVEGREITIDGPAGAPAQTDGDLGGRVPVTVRGGAVRVEVLHAAPTAR